MRISVVVAFAAVCSVSFLLLFHMDLVRLGCGNGVAREVLMVGSRLGIEFLENLAFVGSGVEV